MPRAKKLPKYDLEEDTAALAAIAMLAQTQLRLEADLALLNAQVEAKQKELNQIRLEALPAALHEAKLKDFTLESGYKIELFTDYRASLNGQYREPAIKWLEQNKLESIITREIVQIFTRGDEKGVAKLRKILEKAGVPFSEKEQVNTGTFKAVVKEMLEQGTPVPLSEIGVVATEMTKISAPKKGR